MTPSSATTDSRPPDASQLAAAFVDLARSVNDGKDMVEIFSMLAERCVRLLPVSACGILVIDPRGELEVIGSSNHSAHLLDLFQVQNVVRQKHQHWKSWQPSGPIGNSTQQDPLKQME